MAELATIARPYAEALFKACTDQGADLSWHCRLGGGVAAIAANPQLRQLAGNPNVSGTQVFDLITGVVKSALPETARNFLRVALENGRLDVLPEVATVPQPS